jgi:tetratricopeptide (TPR) repeat protein
MPADPGARSTHDENRTDNVLALAMQAHRAGRSVEAEALYRQALALNPRQPQACYLLGAVCQALGKWDHAEASVRQAIEQQPGHVEAINLLGVLLARRQRVAEALDCFCRAVQGGLARPEVLQNLRLACRQLVTSAGAVPLLERAVSVRPEDAEVHYRLGLALAEEQQWDRAADVLQQATRRAPQYGDAYLNLGVVQLNRKRPKEAADSFRAALRLKAEWPEALYGLGLAYLRDQRPEESLAYFEHAIAGKPQFADAHAQLGQALVLLGRLDDGIRSIDRALELQPTHVDAHCHYGYALSLRARFTEALAHFEQALALQPDHADTHFERSLVLLAQGDWQRGLAEYEWRWRTGRFEEPKSRLPLWDGSDLAGCTILVTCEQGYGDVLQFIRYLPLVQQRGGKVAFACLPGLVPLVSHCAGIDRLVSLTEEAGCNVRASLLSLPWLLGTTPENIPAPIPYLSADARLAEQWRVELPPGPPFKIGLVWQGNPSHRRDRLRSIPLSAFAPLADLQGVQLYSLQKGHGSEQLPELSSRLGIMDLGSRLMERAGPFTDTAAVLKNLDLLICADTAIVHLAGALGVPVFLALNRVPDWRWLLDRDDTPWYPSVRLFRQRPNEDWLDVVSRMRDAVAARLGSA